MLKPVDYLVLKHRSTESPDTGKRKVHFIQLLGAIRRDIGWNQQTIEQIAQHLNVRNISDRRDFLEPVAHIF